MILNETPVRTAKNFNINNIKIDNLEIPNQIKEVENVEIKNNNLKIDTDVNINTLTYGLGELFTKNSLEKSNQKLKIKIDGSKENEGIDTIKGAYAIDGFNGIDGENSQENEIIFKIDKTSENLLENIEIEAEKDTKSTIIIKYELEKDVEAFHNGIIKLCANNIGNKYLTPNKNIKILVNKGKMYFFVTKKT